jgi:Holliday junction resolvase RusA-like endonuclease
MKRLAFTIYMKPEPQGSSKAFVIPGTNRASVTSANVKIKPFRSEITRMAMHTLAGMGLAEPMLGKHVAARVLVTFNFLKPDSCPRSRVFPVVKPDIDKLTRAILDGLTGVAFKDDAQVVASSQLKLYANKESVDVVVEEIVK